ncbi:Uncharacterised protein, partial [Mycoplasma putrefaciens]
MVTLIQVSESFNLNSIESLTPIIVLLFAIFNWYSGELNLVNEIVLISEIKAFLDLMYRLPVLAERSIIKFSGTSVHLEYSKLYSKLLSLLMILIW